MRFRGQVTQVGNCAVFCKRATSIGFGAMTVEANVLLEKRRTSLNCLLAGGLVGRPRHGRNSHSYYRKGSCRSQLKCQQTRRSSLSFRCRHGTAAAEEP